MWNMLYGGMQVVALRTLKQFWQIHPRAEMPLRAWHAHTTQAEWKTPRDIKREYGTAVDFIGDNRVIFDIAGNRYRLIVHISYTYKRVLIKFVGSHADYDRIDPGTVS